VLRSSSAVAAWPCSAKRFASKGLIRFISAISAPATKALSPAPVRIVTRGWSSSRPSSASPISSITRGFRELSFSCRSMVSTAILSSPRSTFTKSKAASLFSTASQFLLVDQLF
jgi:hypothetical protein